MRGFDTPIGMKPVPGTLRKRFAVYMLASRPRGVIYTGMSSALPEIPDSLRKRVGFRDDGLVGHAQ